MCVVEVGFFIAHNLRVFVRVYSFSENATRTRHAREHARIDTSLCQNKCHSVICRTAHFYSDIKQTGDIRGGSCNPSVWEPSGYF